MNKPVKTYIAYIDEFGHDGPFISKNHETHNISPVFGFAGFILPISNARFFSTYFFKMKQQLFHKEIEENTRHPAKWEKKGASYFKAPSITQSKIRGAFLRPVNTIINRLDGHIFYVGSEKNHLKEQMTSADLFKYTLKEAIKRLDDFCAKENAKFILCADYHNNRKEMVETCGIEMFGVAGRTNLIEPLFHAESHLYQTIQFADWIATIVGRCEAYRARPNEYKHFEVFHRYFDKKLKQSSVRSSIRAV